MPGSQFFYGAKPIVLRRAFRTAPALPKSIGECGDVLLSGFVSGYAVAVRGPALLMPFLWVQVSLVGVLEDLPGAFVSGQVILFAMVLGAGTMRVGGKVVVFGGYLL